MKNRHDFHRNTLGLGVGLAAVPRSFSALQSAGAFQLRRHEMTRVINRQTMNGNNTLRSSARIFLCLIFVAGTALAQSVPIRPAQSGPAPGQASRGERLSVEQAVQEALAQNLALRAELERIPAAEGQVRQAGFLPNPALISSATSDRLFANDGERGWTAEIQQEIETAGKRRYRTLTARGDLGRVRYETESTQRDLIARTQKAYFALVQTERDLNLAHETSAILQRFVNLSAERVKVGDAPGVELNLAKVELARTQISEQEFERRHQEAMAGLNLLMGRPPSASVVATSDFTTPLLSLPPEQEFLDYALQHRPEVLATNSNVEARTTALQLARAFRFPNFFGGATYQRQRFITGVSGGATTIQSDQQLGFSVTVPLPLFNRNQGNITSADYERRAAEEAAQYQRNTVANEVTTALANYRSRVLVLVQYEESILPQLQRNLDAIQEAYRLGNENIFTVIQVQRTFFDTRQQYIQALLDLELNRIDLEKVTARPLR